MNQINFNFIARLLTAIAVMTNCIWSQPGELDPTKPSPELIQPYQISSVDLPPGMELTQSSDFKPLFRGRLPDSERYAYFADYWFSPDLQISCEYALCPSRAIAKQAISDMQATTQQDWTNIEDTLHSFELVQGSLEEGYCLFSVDKVVFRIRVFSETGRRELTEQLLGIVHQKLSERGIRATQLTPSEETVIHPGIDLTSGSQFEVRYRVTTEPDLLPLKMELRATPENQELFGATDNARVSLESSSVNGELALSWNGLNNLGREVQEGRYSVQIVVWDDLGRQFTRNYSVPVTRTTMQFSLQLNVLSKHVKPHKNEQARVQATATNPPTAFSYSIYRAGQVEPPQGPPVLTVLGLPAPNGALELVWDGTDASGQRVANGSYVMVVTARDNTGSEASSSAHLVVNFQGGGQGARSLWQLAGPVQRWLSPSDALRLAFPVPCLGAELAGNYLFSPEQLSSTVHRQRAEL